MKMKKVLATVLSAVMIAGCLTGCGSSSGDSAGTGTGDNSGSEFDSSKAITVVSREDGSGTRGAFIELFGIEEKDADGNKVDNTTEDASVTNNTSVMMSTVAGNEYAIGYISLGSLNDSVKAVKIDGNEATVDNIKSGTYKISRPFNIVTKDGLSDVAQDFIDYILSCCVRISFLHKEEHSSVHNLSPSNFRIFYISHFIPPAYKLYYSTDKLSIIKLPF